VRCNIHLPCNIHLLKGCSGRRADHGSFSECLRSINALTCAERGRSQNMTHSPTLQPA
jgi:hypothetical protein